MRSGPGLFALALLSGCAHGEESDALVLSGWSYGWEDLSHRISYLRFGLEQDSSVSLGLVGGDWSTGETATDTPGWRARYERVRTTEAAFAFGTLDLEVGPEGVAEGELLVPAPAELTGREGLVALLSGFEIDTDVPQGPDYPDDYDPGHGYTSNGFGFALGEPTVEGDGVRVPVTATVRWGPQDRPDMNAAIPHAVTGVRVGVTVVGFDGDLARTPIETGATYLPADPDASVWALTEQPPMERDASVEGDGREGFVGWTAFDLQVNLEGDFAGEGDYLRAFGVEAVPEADGPGAWTGTAVATLSTTNLIEKTQLTAGFDGELVRVGVRDAAVEHWLAEGTHPVGAARTGPTLPE